MAKTKTKMLFSNGKQFKNIQTVGDMIRELSLLPPDLRVVQGFSPSADLVIFNQKTDPHLQVEDGGQWDEDADIESQDL